MGPRLRQIDELNRLGLDTRAKAEALGLPEKTVREYEYRIRQIDGERRPRGWHGQTRNAAPQALGASLETERERMRDVLNAYATGAITRDELPLDAPKFYGRMRRIDDQLAGRKEPNMAHERDEIVRETLSDRAYEITEGWRSAQPRNAAEANAATNYYRGQADDYNATREAFLHADLRLERDLPARLEVDEIVVRQRTLEHENERENGLAVGR